MTRNDWIRGLLNDSQGRVFTDERLAPFVELAETRVAILAAALAALSIGALDAANNYLRLAIPAEFVGLDSQKEKQNGDD